MKSTVFISAETRYFPFFSAEIKYLCWKNILFYIFQPRNWRLGFTLLISCFESFRCLFVAIEGRGPSGVARFIHKVEEKQQEQRQEHQEQEHVHQKMLVFAQEPLRHSSILLAHRSSSPASHSSLYLRAVGAASQSFLQRVSQVHKPSADLWGSRTCSLEMLWMMLE